MVSDYLALNVRRQCVVMVPTAREKGGAYHDLLDGGTCNNVVCHDGVLDGLSATWHDTRFLRQLA